MVFCQGKDQYVFQAMTELIARIPLRISASLKVKLNALAEKEHRSLNKQIEFLLDRAVQEESRKETEVNKGAPKFRTK
jgi:hypothetical protein